VNIAIARFDTEFDGEKLWQIERAALLTNRIGFAPAVTVYYFSDAPSPGGGLPIPTTEAVELVDDLLRINLRNPVTQKTASIWVDLKNKKITKSVVDGQEMDLTTGKPYATPLKKN
jgi:hypothetical protein